MHPPELPSSAPLVDAAWLAEHVGRPGVHVVDCRWELGAPGAGRALYLQGHIPGAAFMDLDGDLSGPASDGPNGLGRHPLPESGDFAAAARRAGITEAGVVVAYDQGMTGGAARLWWLLRHHGKSGVAVLDGGLPAWQGALEAGEPAIEPGDLKASAPDGHDLADHRDVLAATATGDAIVVDARAPERFRGETEPVDPIAGHVPGSLSAPAADPLPAWLLDDARPVIASCGSGISACVTLLRLAAAGRDDARLYAGSWSDWVARELPVATGEGPGAL
jgi:thiosulfate/3-mercaptopyruvate sulfurtransferase